MAVEEKKMIVIIKEVHAYHNKLDFMRHRYLKYTSNRVLGLVEHVNYSYHRSCDK